ncbi:hypothetical protein A6A19_08270 [Actinobacillus delphinicola]|uniref:sugar transferase n=1 Tax=Actinobacillus delphinicola TaxID=51161 RepID=UPI002440FA31|nr:sugar transferase [Actinobacillus delphinicola]MDG6897968.1 hypothetical protein [Actinobacillus delphinicola]
MSTKRKTYKLFNLYSLAIVLVALLLPAFIFFGGVSNWEIPSRWHSIVSMAIIFVCTTYSVGRFSSFSNHLGFRYVLFAFFIWSAVVFGTVAIFRLDYSVYYLTTSSIIMLGLFFVLAYYQSRFKKICIAYIPVERANAHVFDNLPQRRNVVWEKIEKPSDFNPKYMKLVMADFRADLGDEWLKFLTDCALKQIPVYHSNRLIEALTGRVKIDHLYENDLGSLLPSKNYQAVKRILDSLLIIATLPITLPVMIVTAIVVALESPGGIFFLQKRVGQGGKLFTVYKFRSMCKNSEEQGSQFAQQGDMRITRVGKFIRKTRIDELPQFFNVLKGDMSLIGPRPEQQKFVEEFEKEIAFYDYRHIVKPGISGWAQVMQGYAFDVESTREKLEHDFYYIKNFSFSMDLLILFKTIQTMLTGFGAR